MTNPLAPSKDHTWRCPGNLDPRHRNYSYDHDRNRLTATAPNGTAHTYAYRPDDAIATDTPTGLAARTFSYDDNGRLTGDGCSSYDYDGFDRTAAIYPASTPSAGCTVNTQVSKTKYDGLDRPAVSIHTDGITTTTTTLGYDLLGSALDTETDTGAVSGTTRYALDGGDNPVALKRTNNGTGGPATGVQQLTADGNGNIATITDSAGALVCDGRYDPYGQPDGNGSATITDACNTTATADTLGYNSVRTDSVSGNQQLGGRTYSPALGGFTTPDGYRAAPADANLGIGVDPLTRNTYGYVNGDPVNLTDPTGHSVRCVDGPCPNVIPRSIERSFAQGPTVETLRQQFLNTIETVAFEGMQRQTAARARRDYITAGSCIDVYYSPSAYSSGIGTAGAPCQDAFDMLNQPTGPDMFTVLRKVLTQDFTSCRHGHVSGCAWSAFDVGQVLDAWDPLGDAAAGSADVARLGGRLAKTISAADTELSGTALARRLGAEGEELAGIDPRLPKSRIGSLTNTAARRVPDRLTDTVLTEVKNVSWLRFTSQLQDFTYWAVQNDLRFDLIVRANTTLSPELEAIVNMTGSPINLIRKLPAR